MLRKPVMFGLLFLQIATGLWGSPGNDLHEHPWDPQSKIARYGYETQDGKLVIEIGPWTVGDGYLIRAFRTPPKGGKSVTTVEQLRLSMTRLISEGCDLKKIVKFHLPQLFDDDVRHRLARTISSMEPNPRRWTNPNIWKAVAKGGVLEPYVAVFREFGLEITPHSIGKTGLFKENVDDYATSAMTNSLDPDFSFHVRPLNNGISGE